MDLRDLAHLPRAPPILAEMSLHEDPFSEYAIVAASGLANRQTWRDLCEEMQAMGLVTVHVKPSRVRYVQATPLGRRVGQLAEEIQALLTASPVRFHGNNRVPSRPAGGP